MSVRTQCLRSDQSATRLIRSVHHPQFQQVFAKRTNSIRFVHKSSILNLAGKNGLVFNWIQFEKLSKISIQIQNYLTTIGMANICVARLTPTTALNGNTSQFPAKPPTLLSDITNEVSCLLSVPVGNVLFALSRSSKLIDAQPNDNPNDSVSKLPKYKITWQ